jgi:hypothetical protein
MVERIDRRTGAARFTLPKLPEVAGEAPGKAEIAQALGLAPEEIGFVSSNGWDAAGASWFGFRVFWVNRGGEPAERLGVAPEREGRSLSELPAWVAGAA